MADGSAFGLLEAQALEQEADIRVSHAGQGKQELVPGLLWLVRVVRFVHRKVNIVRVWFVSVASTWCRVENRPLRTVSLAVTRLGRARCMC